MGAALFAAESGPLTSFMGYCCGPCVAMMCCKAAGAGHVSTNYASRCVLLWLQLVTAVLSIVLSSRPWLDAPCAKLHSFNIVSIEGLGVCGCYAKPEAERNACWSEQIVWRMEGSAFAVFMVLLILSISGCALGASHFFSVAKFMAVFVLGFVSLFLPNAFFSVVGMQASFGAAAFLVAQGVLLMDFSYTWNETWHSKAVSARRALNKRAENTWKVGILAVSAIWLVAAITGCVHLYHNAPTKGGQVVAVVAMASSSFLLVVSAFEWCKHGNLLSSSMMMAYSMWLVFQAFAMAPGGPKNQWWISLAIACASLASFVKGATKTGLLNDQEAPASTGGDETVSAMDYAKQCVVHAAATVYVAGVLAPQIGHASFTVHIVAVFLTIALYGWSLVAPKVLTCRNFEG